MREPEFLDEVAHELQAPLTALRLQLELALEQARGADRLRLLLGRCLEEVASLSRLVSDLLLLSRTEANMERESLDLAAVVRGVAQRYQQAAQTKGVSLRVEAPATLAAEGDPHLLERMVSNLLDNALKFTPRGGSVSVELAAEGGANRLALTDTGVGIPAEAIPRLGERFFQVDRKRSRALGGVGLGLAICRSISRAHGARLLIESEPGRGTRVSILFP
jgi:two-component system phosphate regulon sensor histidine kinase PhoR